MFVDIAKNKIVAKKKDTINLCRRRLHIWLIEAGGTCDAGSHAIGVNPNAVSAFINPCDEGAKPYGAY